MTFYGGKFGGFGGPPRYGGYIGGPPEIGGSLGTMFSQNIFLNLGERFSWSI